MNILTKAAGTDEAGATAEESKTETVVAESTSLDERLKTLFPGLLGENEEPESGIKKPLVAFKHKTVKLFQVGDFTFYDSILYIYNEEDLARFAELYRGLAGVDRVNIVAYDYEAAARVESDASQAIRGMLSTKSIKDPKTIA